MVFPRILPYGQDAVYVDLGIADAPDRAARTHALAHVLRARFPDADVIVGGGVLVTVGSPSVEDVTAALSIASKAEQTNVLLEQTHVIGAAFDGPDLEDVSSSLGLSSDEVVDRLVANHFVVELVGFLPGFGYLGPLDPRLVLPRRKTPRPRVTAGSLGIAGAFAGIYPFSSPGGWHLLGRAVGISLFDPARECPILLAPGDRVRFEALPATDIPPVEATHPPALQIVAHNKPALVVEAAPACATIQALGRGGQLHRGLPPSGPLDPDTFAAANLAVGNDPGEAAIEIPLGRLLVRAIGEVVVSIDGDKPIRLADGEQLEVKENARAVRYLGLRGGADVPVVLGSRATLLIARTGGFSGRPLRKRDVVTIADRTVREMQPPAPVSTENTDIVDIAVDPGPHLDRFPPNALDTLLATTYSISALGDRVGVRIDGEKIPRAGGDSALPVPMVRGAIQVSTDGTPIVFGPDHPTTGGYPVLAVVRRSSWGALARRRPGNAIRFVLGE
ncbi:MAG: carboxyltransferase domain-containing protein [Polyangiaceae bacterium]|nr:carboxyltransferase domain-containing protein [Polyangiaceae bacterium]